MGPSSRPINLFNLFYLAHNIANGVDLTHWDI